jgi:hypothetical protein
VNLLQDGVVAIGKTKLGIIQSETGNVDAITHHHDKLIGQCLSIASLKSIHKNTDTSKRTLAWHFIKNDGYSIFQANSKINSNKPNQINSWQLVFIDNGLN